MSGLPAAAVAGWLGYVVSGREMGGRQAAILLPLFALRSRRDWGVGEIGDLPGAARWVVAAGHHRLQLLPVFELPPGERSPYAALTSAALDPVYVTIEEVEDVVVAGGGPALSPEDEREREVLRVARELDYDRVRALKERVLRRAFRRFVDCEWETGSQRAREFGTFCAEERAWLDPYAIYRHLRGQAGERPWFTWASVGPVVAPTDQAILFRKYVQWQASRQWQQARTAVMRAGVALDGDMPFMVAADSADVWSTPGAFRLEASVGVPPDAFSAAGQDWGLPAPRWERMAEEGFPWLRQRALRLAVLFDGFRVDHVVGYFRTWLRVGGHEGAFDPVDEAAQRVGGVAKLSAVRAAAANRLLTAEDLGLIPDFVRDAMRELGLPGYRVLRWERDERGFRDPAGFPACSVATPGTHDTSPLSVWWTEELDHAGRRALAAVPSFAGLATATEHFTPAVHGALLDGLYRAGSDLVILPLADAYAGRERVNVPATIGPGNWSYRCPWLVEEMGRGVAAQRAFELCARVRASGR